MFLTVLGRVTIRKLMYISFLIMQGMTVLWLTAMIPQAQPPPCSESTSCKSATMWQLSVLLTSFALISIGAGGIRACSIAFGAEQLNKRNNAKNKRVLESFFGWYYVLLGVAIVIGFTGIVYVQDHLGWKVGFAVSAIVMLITVIMFFVASPFYVKKKARRSLLTGFAQVFVAAFRNRKLALPSEDSVGLYHRKKGSKLIAPTDKLR